jgi:hypothetical protein
MPPCRIEQQRRVDADVAGVRPQQAGDGLQGQALAGTGRTEDDDALAVRLQAHVELKATACRRSFLRMSRSSSMVP